MLLHKSLLLVEDEILIRDLLQTALEDSGYSVVTVSHSGEAIQILDGIGGQAISALITDVQLGEGPDGWALARTARKLQPQLPIIYMSGQDARDWPSRGVPNSLFLQKPLTISQVVNGVRAASEIRSEWITRPAAEETPDRANLTRQ